MATDKFLGGATAVAQVWESQIYTASTAYNYILTLTDNTGASASTAYVGTSTNLSTIAQEFVAAWNARTDPMIAKITATQSTAKVVLNADTAGNPYAIAATGTGTWSSTAYTTINQSNTAYEGSYNWTLRAAPIATNDVVFPADADYDMAGYDATAVEIASFTYEEGNGRSIGTRAFPLLIDVADAGLTNLLGTGDAYLGGTLKTVAIGNGRPDFNEATTFTTVTQTGGTAKARSAITTYNGNGGTMTFGEFGVTTASITTVTLNGSTLIYNSTGTITTLTGKSGKIIFKRAVIVTDAALSPLPEFQIEGIENVTWTNKATYPNGGILTVSK